MCAFLCICRISEFQEYEGREVGGGFWMGNTCAPMADSYQCMAKTTMILYSK